MCREFNVIYICFETFFLKVRSCQVITEKQKNCIFRAVFRSFLKARYIYETAKFKLGPSTPKKHKKQMRKTGVIFNMP